MTTNANTQSIATMNPEQLPIPDHKLHGWRHFVGLYAAEHVAATEFVIGATFVALGATTKDILVGLLIGQGWRPRRSFTTIQEAKSLSRWGV